MSADLAPQSLALLSMAMESFPPKPQREELELTTLVRYVAGVLSPDEAGQVEVAVSRNISQGALLAKTYRAVEECRRLTLKELQDNFSGDPLVNEIRAIWRDLASRSLAPLDLSQLTLSGLSMLSRAGRESARIAQGIITSLLDLSLAPKLPELVAATRSRLDLPHLQDFDFPTAELIFTARIDTEGALVLEVRFPANPSTSAQTLWVAFQVNRQWLGLGSARIEQEKASLEVPGFGRLLGLTEGPLPPDLFALRLNEWPSVCGVGAFVVQAGSQPFAEIASDPQINEDNVSVEIRLLPQNLDLKKASELEMWFGTGGHVWQLLGRWPLPAVLDDKMTLQCPSPKPGLVGIAFPGVLKLALRP